MEKEYNCLECKDTGFGIEGYHDEARIKPCFCTLEALRDAELEGLETKHEVYE